MKRYASIILAVIFVVLTMPVLSCSKDGGNGAGTDTGSGPVNDQGPGEDHGEDFSGDILAGLPEMDFKGETFGIYLPNNPESVQPVGIYTEGMNGEIFNDAVYNKNIFIEEKYNVNLKIEFGPDWDSTPVDLKKNVLAGDSPYDLYLAHINVGVTGMTADGLVRDWNDVPYVDFDKPWWNSSTKDMLAINGKIYWTVSSMSMPDTVVLLFNKQMLQNHGLENPYELVRSGKWTIDKLAEISKSVTIDLDNDGKWTKNDQYGLEYGKSWQTEYLMYAMGGNMFLLDSGGNPELNLLNPKMISIYEKMWDLFYTGNPAFLYDQTTGPTNNVPTIGIESDRILFCQYLLNTCRALNAVEVDYGIVPLPKFDEKQENYLAFTHSSLYCIPVIATKEKLEMTGFLMEALARLGHRDILPMYHDTVLKIKTSRDDDSSEMLDIIFGNPTDDIVNHYNLDNDVTYFFTRTMIAGKKQNYISEVEKIQDKIKIKYDEFYAKARAIN